MTTTWYVLSLFAGIGGLDLGLERAGMTPVGQVERDPFCQRVLAKHWPEVPRHDDVRTAVDWWLGATRPRVDVVAGGPPCQPVSEAGSRLAQADDRWLWPAMAEVVTELRPGWVIVENVPGLLYTGAIADVLRDLGQLGYRARTYVESACAFGAPHTRDRLFILAHADSVRCHSRRQHSRSSHLSDEPQQPRRARAEAVRCDWWTAEPDLGRVAYGLPYGVDRRRALGNAVVPQVAEHIGRLVIGAAA